MKDQRELLIKFLKWAKHKNSIFLLEREIDELTESFLSTLPQSDKESKWVSVETGLPEIGIKVQVYCNPNSDYKNPLGVTTGHYWGINEKKTIHNGWDLTDITHWMPLPSPPTIK